MHTRQLGHSDLHITLIGLGAWAIGGEWLFGWGPQDDAESVAVIRHAIKRGLNWIDTAPAYGLGHSEEIVARALKDVPRGERPYVFTKCTLVWDESRGGDPQPGARVAAAGVRGQPAPPAGGPDRPLPDPLAAVADPAERHRIPRGRVGDTRRSQARRQGPLHRRVELQRRPARIDPPHRAGDEPPAPVLDPASRRSKPGNCGGARTTTSVSSPTRR